jgi:hypothetical protein
MRADRAGRRYVVRLAVALATYVVLLLVALAIVVRVGEASPWRWVALALPLPALVLLVLAVGRYVIEADELKARILTQSVSIAFAAGSALTFGYGLMQIGGAPAVSWLWVWPVYAACWIVAQVVVSRRY